MFIQYSLFRIIALFGLLVIAVSCTPKTDKTSKQFVGPIVTNIKGLEQYSGIKATNTIVGELRQQAYMANYHQLAINYKNNVDFQLRKKLIILCPQTANFLYKKYIPTPSYEKGTRPVLEKIVSTVTKNQKTDKDKAICLMRFCRDLKLEDTPKWGKDKIFGGKEEFLIKNGEDLCEALGRLYVGLCEIANIPARIIMHTIGGHITAEAYIDGHWAYIDPKLGIYFINKGHLASLWELMRDPAIIENQPPEVKAELSTACCSNKRTWESRLKRFRERYLSAEEVNGFEYYSLSDSNKYNYKTLTWKQIVDSGFLEAGKVYSQLINKVFYNKTTFTNRPLRQIPVYYRTDGFSQYTYELPRFTEKSFEDAFITPIVQQHFKGIIWGLNAGTRLLYDTHTGQRFGADVPDSHWKKARKGDFRCNQYLNSIIESGEDPFSLAIRLAHKRGLEIYGRYEINKAYGKPGSWLWLNFNDKFVQEHPQFYLKGRRHLNFKFKEVRDYKLAIFREIVEKGCDGLYISFLSHDLWFDDPDQGRPIMTQFIRNIRKILDEVGKEQNRYIKLMIRVPFQGCYDKGLDWREVMKEGLIDSISAFKSYPSGDYFDISTDKFVRYRDKINSKCKVNGHIWQALGLVDTDPSPNGKKRYSKPKTKGMYYAQALIYNRTGCDAIELGYASPQQIGKESFLGELGTPKKIEFADKHYMVDIAPYMPIIFSPDIQGSDGITKQIQLRIADDIGKAKKLGYDISAKLILTTRSFKDSEKIKIRINNHVPLVVDSTLLGNQNIGESFSTATIKKNAAARHDDKSPKDTMINKYGWWKKGRKKIEFPADWLITGKNKIELNYSSELTDKKDVMEIVWVELTLNYIKKEPLRLLNSKVSFIENDVNYETTSFIVWGGEYGVAFDYNNRSVGVKLNGVKHIAKIQLCDNLIDNSGVVKNINKEHIKIYYSLNNKKWYPYNKDYKISIEYKTEPGFFEIVNLDGLDITAEFIKIHYTGNGNNAFDFGAKLQNMVKVYTSETIENNLSYSKKSLFLDSELSNILEFKVDSSDKKYHKNLKLIIELQNIITKTKNIQTVSEVQSTNKVPLPNNMESGFYNITATLYDKILQRNSSTVQTAILLTKVYKSKTIAKLNNDESIVFNRQSDFLNKNNIAVIKQLNTNSTNVISIYKAKKDISISPPIQKDNYSIYIGILENGQLKERFYKYITKIENPIIKLSAGETFTHIRFQKLNKKTTLFLENYRNKRGLKDIIYNNDGYSTFCQQGYDINSLKEEVLRYKGTECTSLDWCTGGQSVNYNSKIASHIGSMEAYKRKELRRTDYLAILAINNLIKSGNDPLKILRRETERIGIRLNLSYRMNVAGTVNPYHILSKYFYDHQSETITGRPSYLSYAYSNYQDYLLQLFEEALKDYDLDGINLDGCRYPPYLLTEQPVLDLYKKKYGKLPKNISAYSVKMIEVRKQIMTDFIRKIHSLCQRYEKIKKKQITFSFRLPFDSYDQEGLDISRWIQEGIIDVLVIGSTTKATYEALDIGKFPPMGKGSKTKFYANINYRLAGEDLTIEDEKEIVLAKKENRQPRIKKHTVSDLNLYMQKALAYYKMGYDGLYIFNNWGGCLIKKSGIENIYRVKLFSMYEKNLKDNKLYIPNTFRAF